MPRNTSIWYDLIAPELTDNQEQAVKALNATGTPEFWIAAAHANGFYGHDSEFADWAAMQKVQLAKDLSHRETDEEEFAHEAEVAGIAVLLFIGAIGFWIACRAYKLAHSQEN